MSALREAAPEADAGLGLPAIAARLRDLRLWLGRLLREPGDRGNMVFQTDRRPLDVRSTAEAPRDLRPRDGERS